MSSSKILLAVLLQTWVFSSCAPSADKVKMQRYMVAGERLYEDHCAACHMPDGSGFKKLYPPISRSSYLIENFEKSICAIRYGSHDSLTINDVQYLLPMPNLKLTNLEVAEIATFIYNSWGSEKGMIEVSEVNSIVENCGAN